MSVGSVFKKMFPFISAAASLGGPLGVMAAATVGNALGIPKLENGTKAIDTAITDAQIKDPAALLKLQEAEQDFQAQMTKLGFDNVEKLAQIDAEDRASARAREIAVKDKIPAILALSVTGGFFGLLYLIAFHEVPAQSATLLNVLVGTLGTAWIGVVNYYFGSSSGSAAKTQLLSQK